jgi:hypothetical protein
MPRVPRKVPQGPADAPQIPAMSCNQQRCRLNTITMASESILLRDDTGHQRSLIIAASNTSPSTLSTVFGTTVVV